MKLLMVVAAVLMGAITFVPKTAAADQSPLNAPWSKKMQELYKTLSELLTDVTSEKRFSDPANKYRIENETAHLASLAHDLKNTTISPDADPTVPLVAALLAQETKRAVLELKKDNRGYARNILRTVPSYCIACHTRNSSGPQFAKLPFEPTSASLTPVERGEFFAATRQFDRAQKEFIQVVQDPKAAASYNFDWEKAVHQSLSIAVRVKKDANQANEIIQAVLNMKTAPVSIQQDAQVWKTSVQDWQAESHHPFTTEEGLYAEALRLMAKAKDTQKYPMDRTADILYLRASAVTHDLLQSAPQGTHAEEALLLAGVSYEVLSPLKTEDLHEFYYEACIRRAPHSSIGDLCYQKYEQSVFFGYSGSGGSDIPKDIQQKLLELRTLSRLTPQIKQ